jgi:Protein of unknown function (DUF1553)/Protein of unknown function (DUF1549)/Concanavalin A-like lectin/glucanases superfamily
MFISVLLLALGPQDPVVTGGEGHWAWITPIRSVAPWVRDMEWARDPLDVFVLARLEARGLAPAPEAERGTWLRRTSLVLTGLPPTVEELDAFEADREPGAYERQADRLLASPRYGEHMAADWLDVARYADTYGYQSDVAREVWPWRDWLIGAFNDNLPYDQFVTWQLAGDLLEDPTTDQALATAFNRLHRQTNEGGSTEEEFRVEYVADRVHTFGTAFLGLTLECARCHDHKYDPISQAEYYSLASYFDNIDESGLYSHFTDAVPTPVVELPTEDQRRAAEACADLDLPPPPLDGAAFAAWRASRGPGFLATDNLPGLQGFFPMETVPLQGDNRRIEGHRGDGVALSGDDPLTFPKVGHFRRWQPFSFGLWLRQESRRERAVVLHRSKAWHDAGSRGYQLLLEHGRPSFSLIHFWPGNALGVRALEALPVGSWHHLAVTYDGSSKAAGVQLYLDGRPLETEVVRDGLTRKIVGGGEGDLTLGERFRDMGFKGGRVDGLAVFERELAAIEVAALAQVPDVLDGASEADLRAVLRARPADSAAQERRDGLEAARRRRDEARDGVRAVMAMVEMPEPRTTYRLERGAYDQRAEPVSSHTPEFLPPQVGGDRLDLARWLVRPDHPLTPRVAVNRLWQLTFGRGLVSTSENFGTQGRPPTHPGLLDHLATFLVDSGWDQKAILRRIVLSATFRQGAADPGDDPENTLLARGPAFRLPAEVLRDQALLTSGLLVEKLGGPSVKPYQPAGLWREKSGLTYTPDQGAGLHRRSLYTFWKRTSPPPAMMILDAAKRDVCVARRLPTSTPLQALLLWNDPQFVEAGRALAEGLLREHEQDPARIEVLFRRLTARRPSLAETRVLLGLLGDLRVDFGPKSAAAFLAVGERSAPADLEPVELASWALLCTSLFSHHGAVNLR